MTDTGLCDLRPLLRHTMNERLKLVPEHAVAESATLQEPIPAPQITAWVEGLEIDLVVEPDQHHFDVMDGLKSADHPLTLGFVGR